MFNNLVEYLNTNNTCGKEITSVQLVDMRYVAGWRFTTGTITENTFGRFTDAQFRSTAHKMPIAADEYEAKLTTIERLVDVDGEEDDFEVHNTCLLVNSAQLTNKKYVTIGAALCFDTNDNLGLVDVNMMKLRLQFRVQFATEPTTDKKPETKTENKKPATEDKKPETKTEDKKPKNENKKPATEEKPVTELTELEALCKEFITTNCSIEDTKDSLKAEGYKLLEIVLAYNKVKAMV